ncbi:MAG TPA: TonB-dependent receptor [Bacteroidota bacterium]|nr:TonB-dependent receptor [Bacteroidota bacterium]
MKARFFPTLIAMLFAIVLFSDAMMGQTNGSVSGKVTDAETQDPLPFVNIVVKGTSLGTATDESGQYTLRNIPPGTYTLTASSVGYQAMEVEITVEGGVSLTRDFALQSATLQLGEVQVYGVSLRRERITEAPAAVSVLSARDIARNASHGQLPKLLESEPGIDMVQSGLYDFNLNTRGFNSSLNRRVLILLDGRDLGTAFLGATEWNGLSIPIEELGRIELVRGPGSALYGANAYNGVLNISSMPPKANPGTRVVLGVGELSMYRADVRHAATIGSWSYRLNLGRISGKTFSKNRNGLTVDQFEYSGFTPGLNSEVRDLDRDPVQTSYVSGRLDYEYQNDNVTTIEGGFTQAEREVIVTGIGRVQAMKSHRPWIRFGYQGHGFNVLLWSNVRTNAEPDYSLATGLALTQDAQITHGEAQYSFSALDQKLFVVVGASHRVVNIDTKRTLMQFSRNDNMSGLFGQLEYRLDQNLKAVLAARFDRTTLHPSQFSPKAALVWSPFVGHTLRVTFNQAFQSPNYSELYLHVKHPLRNVIYLGNPSLVPEKITGYEVGYKGVFDNKAFIALDAYYNQLKDFVTDLAPGVNPAYPGPIVVDNEPFSRQVWSYANAGKVNEGGFELAAQYYVSNEWHVHYNYSQFVFEVLEKHLNDVLLPNAPDFRMSGGITYTHPDGHDAEISVRYTPSFPWAAGIFKGQIQSYTIINGSGSYRVSSNLSFSLSVSNLLNRKHYQIFGGSLIGRRAVVTASYSF